VGLGKWEMGEEKKKFLMIFIITFLVYLNSIFNPFIFDDYVLIVENSFIKNFKFLKLYFTKNLYEAIGEKTGFYRPLQTISYAIIYKIFKLNPVGYHLLNIFLHTGCAILFFILLKDIYGEKISFFVSLLWAIHPVNTEAITYISGTADPLFLFFGLLGIYLYNKNFKILSYISFIISLLSKETSVLILPIFFLYQYCSYRLNKNQIKNYIIITLIFLIYFILRQTILNFAKAIPEDIFLHRFYTSFKAFLIYISILLFPFILSMERHIPYIKTFKDIDFIGGFIFFLAFLYFLWRKRDDRKILFGGTLFLINFIFHSNTIIPLNGNLREHWMYLGSTGFFVYFIILLEKIKKEKLKIALTILIFSLYGARTILRNYDWNDPEKFYKNSLKYFPYAKNLLLNYGNTLMKKGDYKNALIQFEKLSSTFPKKAFFAKGKCYFLLGDYEKAEKNFKKVLQIDPKNSDSLIFLALIYKRKNTELAIKLLEKSIEINPFSFVSLFFLGEIYMENHKYDIAEKIFLKALEIEPDYDILWNKLGINYLNKMEYYKALYCFEKGYKINKKNISVILNLAKLYQRINRHKEAVFYFEKAFRTDKKIKENVDVLNDYAISLNEVGEKEKAIEILNYILKKNPDYKPAKINLRIIIQKSNE
jgi:tetratricopeptide (TPR) repeat protein